MSETILSGAFVALNLVAVVLWIRALTRGDAHRWLDSPRRVGAWKIDSSSFLFFLLLICGSPLLSIWSTDLIFAQFGLEPDPVDRMMVRGYGQFLFWLLACLTFRLPGDQQGSRGNLYLVVAIGHGLRAFLLFVPILTLVTLGWEQILKALNLPIEVQEMVQVLQGIDDPWRNLLWGLQIVVVAPLVEELVFRAGLFRYLLDRLPLKWAVLASSLLFGLIHMSWVAFLPLTLLGALLSLLYAKTGRLAAPVVVHALINLNTFLIIHLSENPY